MIKQIYFDAGNVIFTRRTPDGDNIARALGFAVDDYEPLKNKLIARQTESQKEQFWSIRTIEEEYAYLDEFHIGMCEHLKHPYDDQFIRKLTNYRARADFVINDGVIETLRLLKEKYKLSILSNALPSRRHHELTFKNLISFFDPIIISFEVGVHKPDHRIFEYAIEKASFPAGKLAFIDDKIENLLAAQNAGFGKCVYFGNSHSGGFDKATAFEDLLNIF